MKVGFHPFLLFSLEFSFGLTLGKQTIGPGKKAKGTGQVA
jgi:hypothetical protein